MRTITVAATQMAWCGTAERTIAKAEALVREAAAKGAQVIVLQELFDHAYFPQQQNFKKYDIAQAVETSSTVQHFRNLAKELHVVLPISFYERTELTQYNAVAMIDADGSILGVYRETHIPDGLPYAEKFYFTPGNTGFRVWHTRYGTLGVGIGWDVWYPESARAMALLGAEVLLFPTAIGGEPELQIDSSRHWKHIVAGHAAANMIPIVVSNRVGTESEGGTSLNFYGQSFIVDQHGEVVAEADAQSEGVWLHTFDLDALDKERRNWGIYRDRRPCMYMPLFSKWEDCYV